MTLQIVMGGSDGVVIASDTKLTINYSGQLLEVPHRKVLECGKTRTGEYGIKKVALSQSGYLAAGYAGAEEIELVAANIVEKLDSSPNQNVEAVCRDVWNNLTEECRQRILRRVDSNSIVIVDARCRKASKVRFSEKDPQAYIYFPSKPQRYVILNGDNTNPAGFILERYIPEQSPPIKKLMLLATHYIRMGGILASSVIAGLEIDFSLNGNSFARLPDDAIKILLDQSAKIDAQMRRALLKPPKTFDSIFPSSPETPERGSDPNEATFGPAQIRPSR